MATLLICLSVLTYEPAQANPGGEVSDVEVRALAARKRLQSGEVVLNQKFFRRGAAEPNRNLITSIWFDGKKLRNDYVRHPPGRDAYRDLACQNCQFDGQYLSYNTDHPPDAPALAVSFSPIAKREAITMPVIHPRCLGMNPDSSPNLAKHGPDYVVGRADRKATTVETVQWQGKPCKLVNYRSVSDIPVRIWIVPDYGNAVVKIERAESTPLGELVDSVESEYTAVRPDLWFPRRCTYRRTIAGEEHEREEVDVDVKSLNQPVSSSAFRLEGMDLPVGVSVVGVPGYVGRPMLWDGNNLNLDPVYQKPRPSVVRGPSGPGFPWKSTGAVVLALAAAILAWRAVRTR